MSNQNEKEPQNDSGSENDKSNQAKFVGSRLLKRPSFLVQDFEAPDSFEYFMIHECDC